MVSRQSARLLVLLLALAPAAGLAEVRLERALSALRQDPSFKVRAQAALLLGQGGSGEAVPALRQALAEDPEPAVRIAAAAALGRLGDPAARDALAAAEGGDRDAKVREAAGRVLIELRSAPPGRVLSIEEAQGSAASASARETLRASLARHLALRGFSVVAVGESATWRIKPSVLVLDVNHGDGRTTIAVRAAAVAVDEEGRMTAMIEGGAKLKASGVSLSGAAQAQLSARALDAVAATLSDDLALRLR